MRRRSEFANYQGGDINLWISLYENGLIWKEIPEEEFFYDPIELNHTTKYEFVYSVGYDDECNITFGTGTMNQKEFTTLLKEDWINLSGLLSFCNRSFQGLVDDFPQSVGILIDYYGYNNIFGDSICPFPIVE